MSILWCNGQWLDSLTVSARDRGLMHGFGLFETLLAVDGRPVRADRHLARLQAACQRLGWAVATDALPTVMRDLLERGGLSNGMAKIRIGLTAGEGTLRDASLGPAHLLWMHADPWVDSAQPLRVAVAPWPRNEHSPLAGLKAASYAENLLALSDAARAGFDELLFFNIAGNLCEAATSNVFLIENQCLRTSGLDSGCLPGIARSVMFDLARNLGIRCEESTLTQHDLNRAEAIILTSALRGPVEAEFLEEKIFAPHPISQHLRHAWLDALQ